MVVLINAFAAGASPRKPDPMVSPTMPAPAPVQPVDAQGNAFKAAASPMQPNYTVQQPKPQPSFAGNAFGAFLKGFAGPERTQAVDDKYKQETKDKLAKTLAWLQQTAQLPQDQRMQFTMSNADAIMADTGADPRKGLGNAFARQNGAGQFSDESLQRGIAAISAQLGMSPATPEPMSAYEAAKLKMEREKAGQPQYFNTAQGIAQAGPDGVTMALPIQQNPDPANYDTVTLADGVYAVNKRNPTDRVRIGGAPPKAEGGGETWRDMTPAELKALGYPDGTVGQRSSTGKVQTDRSAKVQSEYTPTQQNKFIQQAQTLDSIDGALKTYTSLIDQYGPTMWTTGKDGDNPAAKKLDAARTAIMIQAKELFNLGVLNGPDLTIIGSAVPGVTGFDALGKSKESVKAQLSILQDYINRGRNQIPQPFLDKARPNAMPNAAPNGIASGVAPSGGGGILAALAQAKAGAQPRQAASASIPQGAAQELMSDPSPEAQQEFDDMFGAGAAAQVLNGSGQ